MDTGGAEVTPTTAAPESRGLVPVNVARRSAVRQYRRPHRFRLRQLRNRDVYGRDRDSQNHPTQREALPVLELGFPDAPALEQGPVARSQVTHFHPKLGDAQFAVCARDGAVLEAQVASLRPANQVHATLEGEDFALTRPGFDDECGHGDRSSFPSS